MICTEVVLFFWHETAGKQALQRFLMLSVLQGSLNRIDSKQMFLVDKKIKQRAFPHL
jgi:hypothetical protein